MILMKWTFIYIDYIIFKWRQVSTKWHAVDVSTNVIVIYDNWLAILVVSIFSY